MIDVSELVFLFVFVFGLIIGSFLNVVIYRIHTGRSLEGRSHCMTCGETLKWYELFPVLSYIGLRARCRSCDAYIPVRYLIVELLTGVLFVFLYTLFSHNPVLLILHAVLGSLLMVIAVYDLRHTIIPDELTFGVGFLALALLIYHTLLTRDLLGSLYDAGCGVLAGGFFFALWYFSKGKWIGLGDAKLALPLGVIAGVSGALSMVVLSFWIGAGISVSLLILGKLFEKGKTFLHFLHGCLTMKSEVPFAPFLILGFITAHYLHANIFALTALLFPFPSL